MNRNKPREKNPLGMPILMGLVFSLIILIGCAVGGLGTKTPVHPGALNDFDSYASDTLYLTQTTLEGLNAHVKDFPQAFPVLQQATADYNLALNTFGLWRCSAGAKSMPSGSPCTGTATQSQVQAALQTSTHSLALAQKAEGK